MNASELAKQTLLKYWDGKLPVDPIAIAQRAGAIVEEDPSLDQVSGYYTSTPRPIIKYNPHESDVRKRFTISHEIGHYLLEHTDSPRDTSKQFSSGSHDPKEVAANRFAAGLLMPKHSVDSLIEGKGITSVKELASIFRVSEVAMQFRLKNLGWLS